MDYCQRYDHHFIGQGRNSVEHARHYITGLMGTQRSKNIETFENDVVGSGYLPRRHREEEELYAQIKKRHAARQRDIDRKTQHKPGLRKNLHLTK